MSFWEDCLERNNTKAYFISFYWKNFCPRNDFMKNLSLWFFKGIFKEAFSKEYFLKKCVEKFFRKETRFWFNFQSNFLKRIFLQWILARILNVLKIQKKKFKKVSRRKIFVVELLKKELLFFRESFNFFLSCKKS